MIDINKKHKFKVGDWVSHSNYGIGKIVLLEYDDISLNKLAALFKEDYATYLEDIQFWEPEKGELVWCWNTDDLLPTFKRFPLVSNWDNIAPFTGTLPETFKG